MVRPDASCGTTADNAVKPTIEGERHDQVARNRARRLAPRADELRATSSGSSAGSRHNTTPSAPTALTDAQVSELQRQVETLQKQLDQFNASPDAAARQQLMQQHWQSMQGYMGQMHDRWGMGYSWMLGHPWSMMGPGMMGGGASWPLPQGVTPDQYNKQMRDYTQRMQEQMNKIAQTTDPQERQRQIGRASCRERVL